MPNYQYECDECGQTLEKYIPMDLYPGDIVTHGCGGTFKRVYTPTPCMFRGSGFYTTDNA